MRHFKLRKVLIEYFTFFDGFISFIFRFKSILRIIRTYCILIPSIDTSIDFLNAKIICYASQSSVYRFRFYNRGVIT